MELLARALAFFHEGGAFMYPIALVLILTLAIALERFFYLKLSLFNNRKLWRQLEPLLNESDISAAETILTDSKASMANVLLPALRQARQGSRRGELQVVADDYLMEVIPTIERRTAYLATFSNIATLLGLLGTVFGLIGAFGALGNADPLEKANLLSAGISEAMSCTAFGLMVAIPALLLHAYLQTQTLTLIDAMETAAVRFIRSLGSLKFVLRA